MSETLYPELTSRYVARTPAFKYETLDSFAGRLLPLNFENPIHRDHLIKRGAASYPGLHRKAVWAKVVTDKAGLPPTHFEKAAENGLRHDDGSQCDYCTYGIDERWACTGCTEGLEARQYPHLDSMVCLDHRRWTGPDTTLAEQRRIDADVIAAEKLFRQLRNEGRIDAVFYLVLRDAFRACTPHGPKTIKETKDIDIANYPKMMAAAAAISAPAVIQQLFDPAKPYADSYDFLRDQVVHAVGDGHDMAIDKLWLFLRPAFLTVRERLLGAHRPETAWAHDFVIPESVFATYSASDMVDQPFSNYLIASGHYKLTAANSADVRVHHRDTLGSPRAQDMFSAICRAGHRFKARVSTRLQFDEENVDWCRICGNLELLSGFNDLAHIYPEITALYRPEDNSGIPATQILVGSAKNYVWVCPAESDHTFTSSVSNRIMRKSDCSICTTRIFIPGTNDLSTRRPNLVLEWDFAKNKLVPSDVPESSSALVWWHCRLGHEWEARISARVQGHGCHECAPRKPRYGLDDFETLHFDLACEWDWERNGHTTPGDIAGSSNDTFHWVCPKKSHRYAARADRRVAGAGCGKCNHRVLDCGETDIASRYPTIAVDWDMSANEGLSPSEVMPGTKIRSWKCVFGHSTRQSVPNRVKSGGCTKCEPTLRSTWLRQM